MDVKNITTQTQVTTAGCINKACRVFCCCPLGNGLSIKLSPSLVKRHPYADRREEAEGIHNLCPLLVVASLLLACCRRVSSATNVVATPHTALAAVTCVECKTRHILPYDNTFAVAVVVPTRWLNLNVLTDGVKAQLLGKDYIAK